MKKELLIFATYIGLCVALVTGCEKENKTVPQATNPNPTVTVPPAPFSIGQSYGGGIVFYVDSTQKHGFVVSKISQGTAVPWSNGSTVVTNASGSSLGWGQENTTAIVSALGDGNYAASLCKKMVINGYDDWYLPSKEELHLIYQQKAQGKLSNLSNDFYWSSTEVSATMAWSQSFSNGANGSTDKSGNYAVCAIRSF